MVNSRWTGPFERSVPNALTVEVEERWHVAASRREGTPRSEKAVRRLLELLAGAGAGDFFRAGSRGRA